MSVSAGKYRAVAQGAPQLAETTKGKPYVAVDFRITQGEHAGEVMPWSGWLTSEKSETRTLASLRYAGWKGDNLADIGPLDQEVEIVVEDEEGTDGKIRQKIAWVNSLAKRLDASKAQALADRLRSKAAATPVVAGTAPVAEDPFEFPPRDDRDPFGA